ncbi:MAG: hypothetical protein EPO57_00670 [Chitinophagaceae bacterium]|nr:MAG: hypothetical protein EPO57_00670 [Chitinophagaceae bacterium]
MSPIIKNILAVVVGFIFGSVVNMGLIKAGHALFPITGIDLNDMSALAAIMPTLEFKHFIFPFLAHALGTFAGAFLAAIIAANHKMKFALAIGLLFLAGGISIIFMLPSPAWFTIVDLVGAYIPMAYLAGKSAVKKK